MPAVRSIRIASGRSTTTGIQYSETVLPEHWLLLKTIYLTNTTSLECRMYVNGTSEAGVRLRLLELVIPAAGWASWEGWIVFNPGDVFDLALTAITVDWWASGALLPSHPNA